LHFGGRSWGLDIKVLKWEATRKRRLVFCGRLMYAAFPSEDDANLLVTGRSSELSPDACVYSLFTLGRAQPFSVIGSLH
jgi:hypothetical protein